MNTCVSIMLFILYHLSKSNGNNKVSIFMVEMEYCVSLESLYSVFCCRMFSLEFLIGNEN